MAMNSKGRPNVAAGHSNNRKHPFVSVNVNVNVNVRLRCVVLRKEVVFLQSDCYSTRPGMPFAVVVRSSARGELHHKVGSISVISDGTKSFHFHS